MSLFSWLFGRKPRRPPIPKSVTKAVFEENKEFFGRKSPTCERCLGWAGSWFKRRTRFHRDHVTAFAKDPYQQVKAAALQVLCDLCNTSKGTKFGPWKAWNRLGLLGLPFRLIMRAWQAFTPAKYS